VQIISNHFYHIYNQGNNREDIFRENEDYFIFLKRFEEVVAPFCELTCYCLMPNHFHFLVNTTDESTRSVMLGTVKSTALSNGFRLLCSGYANEFNKRYNRTGSLFRQKTQAKLLEANDEHYPFTCFHYIHQNPMTAGLCKKMEDWEFSSFLDYCGLRNGLLVNKRMAYELIGVSQKDFYKESYMVMDDSKVKFLED
jgi:REP element-mobilizing transposase RayT